MSAYMGILFVHVASAVLLLATSIVGEPVVRAAARRATSPSALRAHLEIGRRMGVIAPAAALAVLASGLYLTAAIGAWSLAWVQLSLALWLANSLLAALVVKPAVERVARASAGEADAALTPELEQARWSRSWTWGGDLLAVNDAAMLLIMVAKPSLTGCVAVLLSAYAGTVAVRFAARLRGTGLLAVSPVSRPSGQAG